MDIFDLIKAITSKNIDINACALSEAACKIFPKDSSSNTVIGFCNILEKSVSSDPLPVVTKIFLSVAPPKRGDSELKHKRYMAYQGLIYEANVYKKINNILRYTPNLIPYIGYGECEVSKIKDYFRHLQPDAIELFLATQFPETYTKSKDRKLHILITGRPQKSMSLLNILNITPHTENIVIDKLKLWFQLIYTLKVLSLFEVQHNDLHENNVLVAKYTYDRHKKILYVVNNTEFLIDTANVVLMFDWDRAYVPDLGKNKLLEFKQSKKTNVINKIQPKFDLFTITCFQTMDFYNEMGGFINEERANELGIYKDLLNPILKGISQKELEDIYTPKTGDLSPLMCRPLVDINDRAMDYIDILNLPVFKRFVYDKDRDGDYDYKYVMPVLA